MNLSLLAPDILDSPFAHTLHVLLIGGVIVYGWQSVTALVRKPKSVGKALRKAVNAAWLAILFLLITQPNPVPYLRVAATIAAVLIVLKVWDRATAPAKQEELLASGPAGVFGREAERSPAAVNVRRD